jgi:hypothetical protein
VLETIIFFVGNYNHLYFNILTNYIFKKIFYILLYLTYKLLTFNTLLSFKLSFSIIGVSLKFPPVAILFPNGLE